MELVNYDLKTFWDRIKKLISAKGVTQKQFSVIIGKKERIIENQISLKCNPDIEELINMAKFLDCSIDYLIFGADYSEKMIVERDEKIRSSLEQIKQLSAI